MSNQRENAEMSGASFPERIAELIDANGGPTKTSKMLEVSMDTIYKWKSGKSRMPFNAAYKLTRTVGVSMDWLATGIHRHAGTVADGLVRVKRFNIGLSAGDGATNCGELIEPLEFRRDWLRSHIGVSPEKLTVVYAMGDSMEPTIRNGALLLVDNSSRVIKNDGVYAFRMDDSLFIKRVQTQMTGGVLLLSDNSAYPPQAIDDLERVQFTILGQVRWVGNDL